MQREEKEAISGSGRWRTLPEVRRAKLEVQKTSILVTEVRESGKRCRTSFSNSNSYTRTKQIT